MTFTPLVAMQSKMGEFESLLRLADGSTSVPRVVVDLRDEVDPASGRLMTELVKAAVRLAYLRQPMWIDAGPLSAGATLSRQPGGAFRFLDDRIEAALLEEHGLLAPDVPAFVPVVPARSTDEQLSGVALLQEHRSRPVVVRFRDLSAGLVDDCLRRVSPAARGNPVHAVVDLGFVETVDAPRLELAQALVRTLTDRLGPSSTTVLAGSIPRQRDGFVTTVRERPEVVLWGEIAQTAGSEVHYGDYGVAHPDRPAPGGSSPRTPYPYLYYTVPSRTIAMRRKPAERDGTLMTGEAFTDLADELVARPEFAGSTYSWGDHALAGCRRGGGRSAATASKWVAMAMSHHLEHLAKRSPAEL
ncbi:hypothetical protein [Lentzea sp. NPDC060358]|uniref:beta family protein n=1 Tax=Lentzea sp. NPDC060358 TaxID=3347103 RepID=UPI003647DA9B